MSKSLEMYLFLFDDILLLTKIKKSPRKVSNKVNDNLLFARIVQELIDNQMDFRKLLCIVKFYNVYSFIIEIV